MERVTQACAKSWAQIRGLPLARLKFIAESGVKVAMTLPFDRVPRGARGSDAVPKHHGRDVTVLAACHSLSAVMTVEGPTDAAVFRAYVEQALAPTLVTGDIAVMDHLSAHKVDGIHEAIEATGAQVLYLPPYSPDFSPIEPGWAKLKSSLRTVKARTRTENRSIRHDSTIEKMKRERNGEQSNFTQPACNCSRIGSGGGSPDPCQHCGTIVEILAWVWSRSGLCQGTYPAF